MSTQSMTYNSLVTDIKSYANKDDDKFSAQVDRFIMLAENSLAANARGLGFLKLVKGKFAVGSNVIVKPERWRETGSFWYYNSLNKPIFLKSREYEFVRIYAGDAGTADPEYYSDYGYERVLIAGTPGSAYDFEYLYFERPEPLSESNQTNWTTQYSPGLLLWSSLVEAHKWLKNPEKVAEFQGYYTQSLKELAAEADRRVADQSFARRSQ